jgi:uncharacterized protein (UPF0332 family)
MRFDWSGYLTLAGELAERSDEASLRSALSRAYYYVYHLALLRAQTNGFTFTEGGMHAQLWRTYSGSPDAACTKLGQIADRLREKRTRADYEDLYPRITEDAQTVVADAQDFVERLNKLDKRFPNPSSIRR